MTVITHILSENRIYALTKGAPETIAQLLLEKPANYEETYRHYTRQGCRVLAMAIRDLGNSYDESKEQSFFEKDLIFVGFIIFSAPIKRGSEDTIVSLLKSSHRVVIITGDEPLTASHVAQKLHIIQKPVAIVDESVLDSFGAPVSDLSTYSLCYTGRAPSKVTRKRI